MYMYIDDGYLSPTNCGHAGEQWRSFPDCGKDTSFTVRRDVMSYLEVSVCTCASKTLYVIMVQVYV